MTSASALPCRRAPAAARQFGFAGALGWGASGAQPSGSYGCGSRSAPGISSCPSGRARRTPPMSSPKQ
eukprot:3554596-Alexandrium_andersonii.AAC.1